MTTLTLQHEVGARRLPVSVDRVACWRIGPVELDRCRECVYLMRLEGAHPGDPRAASVVCLDCDPALEVDFAW
jgi:hypothetical protein